MWVKIYISRAQKLGLSNGTGILITNAKIMNMIENPNDMELRTLKGIIYLITNKITGDQYVGKSINTFTIRYPGRKWWKGANRVLAKDIAAYGLANFKLSILDYDILDNDILHEMELFYINEINTMYPNGYNLIFNVRDLSRFAARARAKTYSFYDNKEQKMITITNLTAFCRENNLVRESMVRLIRNRAFRYKQFTLPNNRIKTWLLISPDGERFRVLDGELRPFCRKMGICKDGILAMINGKCNGYKGWSCPDNPFKYKDRKMYSLISPTGEILTLGSCKVRDFISKNSLELTKFRSLIYGITKQYNGWRLRQPSQVN